MNVYKSYWSLYQKITDSSKIRNDEKKFIKKCINNIHGHKLNLGVLIDLGCGDGRISAGFCGIANFEKIILVDATDSVNIARDRVSEIGSEILCVKTDEPFDCFYGFNADVLVCSGLINYFKNQNEVIMKLFRISPQVIFISVTGYNIFGVYYKILNSIRIRFLYVLLASLINFINDKIKISITNKYLKRLIVGVLRFIEPFVSPRIYWLKEKEYELLFVSNGYQIIDSGTFGFSNWYCLKRD